MKTDGSRFAFTKEKLLALPLPPEGGRATYHDTKAIGLQLRVTPQGTKTFSLYRRVKGGAPGRITLGKFPSMTIEQARQAAASVNAEIEGGANPAEARRALRGEPTFEEVFVDYLTHKRKRDGSNLSERTKAEYRNTVRLYLQRIAPQKLSAITHDRVAQIHRQVGKQAPFAANRTKALISAVFNYAKATRTFTGDNPANGLVGFAEVERDRYIKGFELPYILEAIEQSEQADFFMLALLTGARRSNLQAMTWRCIDWGEELWRIPNTKNGTPQNVTLSPEALAILHRRKADTESMYVFPGRGSTGHLVEPKKAWRSILKRASLDRLRDMLGADPDTKDSDLSECAVKERIDPADYLLTDLRIHDLRRTLGSWQATTGASLPVIGKSLNHKSQRSTMIYARLELDPVRDSVKRATASMLGAKKQRR